MPPPAARRAPLVDFGSKPFRTNEAVTRLFSTKLRRTNTAMAISSAIIQELESASLRSDLPEFRVGDTIAVHYKIVEGDKMRTQVFKGIVIKQHRAGARSTITVRKTSFHVGVERTFMLHTPRLEKIEVVARGVVRRSRLFYLRDLSGKAARVRDKRDR
jgi:large subunit ribosomal protein L19